VNIPFKMPNMTIQWCVDKCYTLMMSYAGLQYSDECWCGMSYGLYGKLGDFECNYPCAGEPKQKCGGIAKNSVYDVISARVFPKLKKPVLGTILNSQSTTKPAPHVMGTAQIIKEAV